MESFSKLLNIIDRLLGPDGCPWDREQTLFTLQPYLLEETHELIEAIDSGDFQKISEEIGDVLFELVFMAKLAQMQGKFSVDDAMEEICEKLIRRHPHVFSDVQVSSQEEIMRNWDAIKKLEKGQQGRKEIFDGIPPSLPALPRAQKMAERLRRKGREMKVDLHFTNEEEVGAFLWEAVGAAEKEGFDAESALRRHLSAVEQKAGEGLTA